MPQLNLGAEVPHAGEQWRVVRLVAEDLSLFEDADGSFIIKDSFAMIKSPSGKIDFIVFSTERIVYEGPKSSVKALDTLPWRQP